jgi:hypothetical protein
MRNAGGHARSSNTRMASATLASTGAGATFRKHGGGGQRRKLSAAVEAAAPRGESRGGVSDASATHPSGAGEPLAIPLILLLLAAGAGGLTRLARRDPRAVPGRREWPPIEPPAGGDE